MKKYHLTPFYFAKKYKKALLMGLLVLPIANVSIPMSANELSFFEQSYALNLSFNNTTLENAIEKISKQANVRIIYSNDQIDTQKKISVNIQTTDIKEALKAVLGDGYLFKQENK